MGKFLKSLIGVGLTSVVLLAFQNCGGQFNAQNYGTNSLEELASRNDSAKFECQYIGVETLQARLSAILGITSQDVPILNDNGTASNRGRIATNKAALGAADPAAGKYADYSCEMAKFKLSTEIMIDACKQAMATNESKARLFPDGALNFDRLYLTFLGRIPTDSEYEVLANLANSMPEGSKEAATCAATAMSFEALTRI